MKLKYLFVLLALVLLVGCGAKTDKTSTIASTPTAPAVNEPVAPQPPVQAEAPAKEASVDEKVVQKGLVDTDLPEGTDVTKEVDENQGAGFAVDVTPESEMFSQVNCADGKISVMVKNTGSDTWILEKAEPADRPNVGFMNRGVADPTPGCEKKQLEAGESTKCSTIDTGIKKGVENRVAINTPDGSSVRVVTC
jgi:hypothetical protein